MAAFPQVLHVTKQNAKLALLRNKVPLQHEQATQKDSHAPRKGLHLSCNGATKPHGSFHIVLGTMTSNRRERDPK
jgi:hypothetical protein